MITLTVRYMTLEDLDAVMEIENTSFDSPWSRQSFKAEIAVGRPYSHSIVAVLGDEIVSFLCFQYVVDQAHLINFAVHPDHRRLGYGRRLLKFALGYASRLGAKRMVLEVRMSNRPAIQLYRAVGFRVLGRRARYYSDNGEDAYVMELGNLQEIDHG